jgi:ketosteroid isomerase-like protein
MSANEDLVRRGLELFEREGAEALLAIADEEIEVKGEGDLIDTATYHGHEGFKRWSRRWLEAWEDFRMTPRELIEVGEHVVVVPLHRVGVGRTSGIEVETDVAYLVEIRDGKMTRLHLYSDAGPRGRAGALRGVMRCFSTETCMSGGEAAAGDL